MNKKLLYLWKKYVTLDSDELSTPVDVIRENYKLQVERKDWTLYQERTFMETLFCTRFNYYVTAFSILTAATARIEKTGALIFMLFISAIILSLMALSIYRIYTKLLIILKLLYKMEDYHVFNMVHKEISDMKNFISIPVNAIIGVIIPFFSTIAFWIYAIYSLIMFFV